MTKHDLVLYRSFYARCRWLQATTPGFVMNRLLIATNSMIVHEIYFASLGDTGVLDGALNNAPRA